MNLAICWAMKCCARCPRSSRSSCRKIDVVCRYGGEEFAVLLSQTSQQHALGVAEKLRRMVDSWQFPGVPRSVTISAGVATCPDHGSTREELVKAADAGLYAAKQAGELCAGSVGSGGRWESGECSSASLARTKRCLSRSAVRSLSRSSTFFRPFRAAPSRRTRWRLSPLLRFASPPA